MSLIEVYKFGGASVKDAQAIRNAGAIIKTIAPRPVAIVISAMGKTTNLLETIINAHFNAPERLVEIVEQLKAYHADIVRELLGDKAEQCLTDLHDLWVELGWILEENPHANYNYHYDQIIVFGELASTKIVSAYIAGIGVQHTWLDARGLIKTDNAFREARIDWELTKQAIDKGLRPGLARYGLVITQGFIGSTVYNESTSLGREGSDYTAAILAFVLDAASVTIWKDVPGIMTGDPKRFNNVSKLDEITYTEAIEMTYYGAKVIHPKTLKPLQNKNIPLYVRPFDNPTENGTKIGAVDAKPLPPIVVVESNQVLLRISTRDFSFVAEEHLSEIFTRLANLRIKVNSMRNNALSFMVCMTHDAQKLQQLMAALEEHYFVSIIEHLELFTVRHATDDFLNAVKQGKEILFEEQFGKTDQFITNNE